MSGLVSIIIPVYNKGEHLNQCIHSVLNQNYQNLEIIVIDDHSNDNSLDKLSQFKDSRLSIYKLKKNSGSNFCRNLGLSYAQGDFLLFLDADDYIDISYVNDMVEQAVFHEADLTIANWCSINGREELNLKSYLGLNGKEILSQLILRDEMLMISSYLISRKAIEPTLLYWDENITINQDGVFFMKILLRVSCIAFNELSCSYYNRSSVELSRLSVDKIDSLILGYEQYEYCLRNIEIYDRRHIINKLWSDCIFRIGLTSYRRACDLVNSLELRDWDPIYPRNKKFAFLLSIIGIKASLKLLRWSSLFTYAVQRTSFLQR